VRLIEQWEVSMTFRRIATLIGLAVALTGGVGLQAKTVTLGTADNRTDISLNLGDTLVVELSSGDVNGFSWVLHLPKDSGLTAIGDDLLPAGKKAAAQDTSAYSVRVHIASGAPRPGAAILFGVYKGTLPCADCNGLDTVLRLYAKGKFDYTYAFYVRTQTYVASPHGDMTISDRGEWTLLRGDATDENASVYQLNPDSEQRSESLLVQDNGTTLTQLDKDLKPIDTTLNISLKKVP
jgi:copper homeostasis protein (lipoprotein)